MLLGTGLSSARLCALGLVLLHGPVFGQGAAIKGAGATFPAGVYAAWATSYAREKGVAVEYLATGSGDGIKRILEKSVDFGGTDSPVSESELAAKSLVQFPTLLGGVVPIVNLPGIRPGQLRLSGVALADIFAGRINVWNDPRIRKLNPELSLPSTSIVRVVREDASGTTRAFTAYLSSASDAWKAKIGAGLTVPWAVSELKAKGNDGVGLSVSQTPGSIGYVSYNLVLKNRLISVSLENRSGRWVSASEEGFASAAKASGLGSSAGEITSLIDQTGPYTWPITEITYVVLDGKPQNAKQAAQVLGFFYWVFLRGDEMATGTGFVALPSRVQAKVVGKLTQVKSLEGKSILLGQAL